MKLLITGPMYWTTKEIAERKAWLYLASAKKAGVSPEQFRPYGIGATFYPGTATMRIYDQITFLIEITKTSNFTHVLFTDLWDVLFVQPLTVILEKYKAMGSPSMLVTGCPQDMGFLDVHEPEKFTHLFDLTKPFCYPATHFHIGEIPYVIEQLNKVPRTMHNESYAMIEAFNHGFSVQIDYGCEIFQEGGIHAGHITKTRIEDGRVYNPITGSYPCLVHFGGGYVDPVHGKDDAIMPWAKELGII